MSETVQKKIEVKIFKSPLTDSEMKDQISEKDIKVRNLGKASFYLGEILVDQQIYGMLGLEKEYWTDKSAPDQNLESITINLYDKKGTTMGVIEERLLKELMQSVVSGKMPVFSITFSNIPYLMDIERESDKLIFPLLMDVTKGIFEIFQITKKGLAMGADFTVIRKLGEEKVAFIDSKMGGKVEVSIYDETLAKNKQFINTLALFAASIKFHDEIGEKIKSALESLKTGSLVLKPSKKALELMLNPRRAKGLVSDEEETEKVKGPEKLKEVREKRKKRKIRGEEEEEPEKDADLEGEEEELEEKPKRQAAKQKLKTIESASVKSKKYQDLLLEDPVRKVSGITKEIAEQLQDIGISTVEDFLSADPEEIETALNDESITNELIQKWINAARKRVRATLEDIETKPDDSDDYDALDEGL